MDAERGRGDGAVDVGSDVAGEETYAEEVRAGGLSMISARRTNKHKHIYQGRARKKRGVGDFYLQLRPCGSHCYKNCVHGCC